jgi:hypothetical protein
MGLKLTVENDEVIGINLKEDSSVVVLTLPDGRHLTVYGSGRHKIERTKPVELLDLHSKSFSLRTPLKKLPDILHIFKLNTLNVLANEMGVVTVEDFINASEKFYAESDGESDIFNELFKLSQNVLAEKMLKFIALLKACDLGYPIKLKKSDLLKDYITQEQDHYMSLFENRFYDVSVKEILDFYYITITN